jgi:hypothetical protein
MALENLSPYIGDGWDYFGYDPDSGRRILGRIIPSSEGTIAIAYRVETLDGARLLDSALTWADIARQISLLPASERGGKGTDQAVALAIREDLKTKLP